MLLAELELATEELSELDVETLPELEADKVTELELAAGELAELDVTTLSELEMLEPEVGVAMPELDADEDPLELGLGEILWLKAYELSELVAAELIELEA